MLLNTPQRRGVLHTGDARLSRKPKGEGVGDWIYDEDKPAPKPNNRPHYVGPYNSWAEHKAAVEEMNMRQQELDYGLKDSLTPGAKQLDWKTPTEFPLIPQTISDTPLQDYLARLPKGAIYARNLWGESPVYDAAMAEDGSHLAVQQSWPAQYGWVQ